MQKWNHITFFQCFPVLKIPNLVRLFSKDSDERGNGYNVKGSPRWKSMSKCLLRDTLTSPLEIIHSQTPMPKISGPQSCSSYLFLASISSFIFDTYFWYCTFQRAQQHVLECTMVYTLLDLKSLIRQPSSSDAHVLITKKRKRVPLYFWSLKGPISRLRHANPGARSIFLIIA